MKRIFILILCSFFSLFTLAQSQQSIPLKYDSTGQGGALPIVSVENAVVTGGENGGCYIVLFLSLSKRSKDPVKVQYNTASNAGSDDEDYLQKKGTIIFPSNRLFQTIKVPVDCEVQSKSEKTFVVKLSGFVNAVAESFTVVGTINNSNLIRDVSLHKSLF